MVLFYRKKKEKEDNFDADVAISTGELGQLIPELVEVLGGELLEFGTTPAGVASAGGAAGTVTTGRAHQATAADLATADDGSAPF